MTASRTVRVAAAVLVQAVLVAVAVWAPLSARLAGEEILLRVEPVDPIDPFRGAYVDLGYPDLPDQPLPPEGPTPGADPVDPQAQADDTDRGPVYVSLVREGEVWVAGARSRTRPADGVYLACDDADWRLRCGIESYFLPQDRAREMEAAVRSGTAVATVRVDGRGHAALVRVDARP